MIQLVVFVIASLMVLVGAVGVVVRRHPVHCALSLVLTLFGIAVHFVALEAHFLAAVQIIVYAGAIVVLFLFVIMLLGVDKVGGPPGRAAADPAPAGRGDGPRDRRPARRRDRLGEGHRPAQVGAGIDVAGATDEAGAVVDHDANIRQLARNLFGDNVFAFELTSVLLIVAVAGTVVLTRRQRRRESGRRGRQVIADIVPTTTWYLVLGAVLFGIGAVGVLVRRNPLVILMSVELMLNAVNLSFVALSRRLGDIGGQTAVFFVLVIAAAEVVVGLGITVAIMRRRPGATADDLVELKG